MSTVEIKYDTPIEVTKEQLDKIRTDLAGVCAYRTDENGKHWIKCLLMKYKHIVEQYLR